MLVPPVLDRAGLDNVRLESVPDPSGLVTLAIGLFCAVMVSARRCKRVCHAALSERWLFPVLRPCNSIDRAPWIDDAQRARDIELLGRRSLPVLRAAVVTCALVIL